MVEFERGLVVYLRGSTHQSMAVDTVDGDMVTCEWIDKDGKWQRRAYHKDILIIPRKLTAKEQAAVVTLAI